MAAVEVGVEQREPFGALRRGLARRRAGEQQHLGRNLGGGNPDLAAGDEVAVAVAHRAGRKGEGVEAGIGLGDGEARLVVPGDERRQHPALLRFGAEPHHRVEAEDVHVQRRGAGQPGARLRHRLHQDGGLGDAEPAAAMFLGDRDAEEAGFGEGAVKILGEAAVAILGEPIGIVERRAQPLHRRANLGLVRRDGEHRVGAGGRRFHDLPLRRKACVRFLYTCIRGQPI